MKLILSVGSNSSKMFLVFLACACSGVRDQNFGNGDSPASVAAGSGGAGTPSGATAGTTPSAAGPAIGRPMAGTAAAAGGGRSSTPVAGANAGASAAIGGVDASAGASGVGSPNAGASGTTTDAVCNAADRTPDAKPVAGLGTGAKPTGPSAVVVESDPGIADHTVYRPDPIGTIKHPIVAWGNGGCSKDSTGFSEFLMELTSHGFLIIADGTPGGTGAGSTTADGTALIKAIDWAAAENERPCSKYYHKLDVSKVAVSGQSCGGLMAIGASTDKRITTSMPMNSGLFSRDSKLYDALHAPMAIIDGGSDDIAYANGQADFMAISNIPLLFANSPTGHGGTYWQDNGGEFATVAVAWLSWWLLDDQGPKAKGMFIGDSCGLCGNKDWDLMWKMKPQ